MRDTADEPGRDTTSVNEKRDGLDFFYSERNQAIKMVDFLAGVVPVRWVFHRRGRNSCLTLVAQRQRL